MSFTPFSNFLPAHYWYSWLGPGGLIFPLIIIWSLFWKGWALWQTAKSEDRAWFVILLVVNTAGILEIAYLFLISSNSYSNRERVKQLFSK